MTRLRLPAILVPLALVAVAGALRLFMLDEPGRIIFDETYYVNDARAYLQHGVEDGFAVHPPVGKWLIAAGIALAGDNPFGWRVAGAVAGTLTVLVTYLAGMRLLRWRGAAAFAGLLAALDGLLFVQARTSMLDAFLALFVVAGAWLLLVDRDRSGLADPAPDPRPRRRFLPVPAGGSDDHHGETASALAVASEAPDRPLAAPAAALPRRDHTFRLVAGVSFGLATATKWSGLLALAAAALVAFGWELGWRRRQTGRFTAGFWRLTRSLLLAFVAVPAAIYVLSYVPWVANYAHTSEGEKVCTVDGEPQEPCHVALPDRVAGWWRYQQAIANFHLDLEADHPYRAPAHTWLYLGRPVVYYWENCTPERASGIATTNSDGEAVTPEPCVVEEGRAAEIIALGNPALWWIALLAAVPLAVGAIRRDGRAWYLLAFWGVQFVPWLVVRRPAFIFYMVPVVPFLALAVAYATVWLDESRERSAARRGKPLRRTRLTPGAAAAAVVAALAAAAFVYFYPIYTGMDMDADAVRQRWWFDTWI